MRLPYWAVGMGLLFLGPFAGVAFADPPAAPTNFSVTFIRPTGIDQFHGARGGPVVVMTWNYPNADNLVQGFTIRAGFVSSWPPPAAHDWTIRLSDISTDLSSRPVVTRCYRNGASFTCYYDLYINANFHLGGSETWCVPCSLSS